MEAKQIELLALLAKKIRAEDKDINKVLASLQSAKILTKKRNFTSHYKTLSKVVTMPK